MGYYRLERSGREIKWDVPDLYYLGFERDPEFFASTLIVLC